MSTITKLTELTETSPMNREINRGLMVWWINQDLVERARLDVRKSLVLYDEDKVFYGALDYDDLTVVIVTYHAKLYDAGVRYYSKGIV